MGAYLLNDVAFGSHASPVLFGIALLVTIRGASDYLHGAGYRVTPLAVQLGFMMIVSVVVGACGIALLAGWIGDDSGDARAGGALMLVGFVVWVVGIVRYQSTALAIFRGEDPRVTDDLSGATREQEERTRRPG